MPRPKAGSDDVVADRRMDAVANSSASAPAATAFTAPSWPLSGFLTGVPSASRHTRTVPSR